MNHMPCYHGCPIDRIEQVSWSAACGSGRELETNYGEVHTQDVGTGVKVGLWYGATVWRDVGENRGGYSHDASLVGAAYP